MGNDLIVVSELKGKVFLVRGFIRVSIWVKRTWWSIPIKWVEISWNMMDAQSHGSANAEPSDGVLRSDKRAKDKADAELRLGTSQYFGSKCLW